MTPDETERRIEFIIEQQARFAAQIDQLLESDQRLRESVQGLRDLHVDLTQSQMNLNAALRGLTEVVKELGQAQKHTDERLNALIGVVERHITGHNHGRPAQ